ncbi:YIP1 family protein [Roseateles sp. L2-2]|uniref:YIP1 family protein n=1 Tax=Roseateles TaxID=93681 RepID=UPI003D36B526
MQSDLPPSPALPPDAAPGATSLSPSPLSPRAVFELYFKPRTFFGDIGRLSRGVEFLLAVYLIGAVSVMEKLDDRLARALIAGKGVPTDTFTTQLLNSWWYYWGVALGSGILAAAIAWLVAGWFYRVRLKWSGAVDVDPTLARRVWAFQSLVYVLPILVITVVQTAMYPNYLDAWSADELITAFVPLVVVFWGCWTSYVGATTVFQLERPKAQVWFLILPALLYAVLFFGAAVAMFSTLSHGGS